MRASSKRSGAVVMAMVSCLVAVAVAQPVINNRSFESGAEPGDAIPLAPGSKALESWTVVDGNISYVGRKWQPAQGARSVGLLCGGGITQTFETEPDQHYEVRFSMAGDPSAAPGVKTVVVSLGADTRTFTFDTAGHTLTDMGWASRTWVFKASAKSSTLAFRSPKAQCSVPAVDNIRVDPVAACVQAGPGAAGCGNPRPEGIPAIPTAPALRAGLALALAAHPAR